MGIFDGCKECDKMFPSVQYWMMDKVSWRCWYLLRPDVQESMHRVAKDAHELDPSKKSALHESYHNKPNQVAGEKITAKLFSKLFEPFVEEKGISNPGTADLMEVMEKMVEGQPLAVARSPGFHGALCGDLQDGGAAAEQHLPGILNWKEGLLAIHSNRVVAW